MEIINRVVFGITDKPPRKVEKYIPAQGLQVPTMTSFDVPFTQLLTARTVGQTQVKIYPGDVFYITQSGKIHHYYTFGGSMDITDQPYAVLGNDRNNYQNPIKYVTIDSPAPIFYLTPSSRAMPSITSFQAELARIRTDWLDSDQAFIRKLTSFPPLTLFRSAVILESDRLSALRPIDDIASEQIRYINQLLFWIKNSNLLPEYIPSLRELILNT